jgi:Uma2 family endonuclease
MSTLLRMDAETLPRTLVFTPPLTETEFEVLCRESDNIRFERTKDGTIWMNPPAGGWTSDGNAEIIHQLRGWWDIHEQGRVFDSSAGFRLPDGSILSPDAAYASAEALSRLPKGELKGFARLRPDFVIELLSESDALSKLQQKMQDWMTNGAALGWLVDPYARQVIVYRKGEIPVIVDGNSVSGHGPVQGFVLNLSKVWTRYSD